MTMTTPSGPTSTDPRPPAEVLREYFNAWAAKDFARLRALLADDVTFVGPLGRAHDADRYVEGIARLSEIVEDVVVEKMVIDGPDVMTWFELRTSVAEPRPVVNWSTVESSRIKRVRVAFDPRGLAPASSRQGAS
jgi:hypothetical protein